jgi:hypothetical protein
MDNIKMALKESGWDGWTGFTWLRIGTEPLGCIKYREFD